MDNITLINQRIGKNIAFYRKEMGLTQAELGEKISYSDKSVSKWESGNGAPDVYVLLKMSHIFGVSVNDLLGENAPKVEEKKKSFALRLMIMLLSSGIVWLVATCMFVSMRLWRGGDFAWWMAFIYALPINSILLVVFSAVWRYKFLNFVGVSALIWTLCVSAFLSMTLIGTRIGVNADGAWLVFLLGVPLQVLEVLWVFFRYLFIKSKQPKKVDGRVDEHNENGEVEAQETGESKA